MFKKVFILLLLLNFSSALQYQCEIQEQTKYLCKITGLNLTKDNSHIEPVADDPGVIKYFYLLHGTLPLLSRETEFCKPMPDLKQFITYEMSIEEIDDHAFETCSNLIEISLSGNKLSKLERDAFRGLRELKTLWIDGGNVPLIDLDLSDSRQLSRLSLTNLNISTFSTDVLREQANLRELGLFSNNLQDLDVEGIVKHAPNLKEIYLADNYFNCSRLQEILDVLKRKNIKAGTAYKSFNTRERTFEMIEGIHCLSDQHSESSSTSFEEELLVESETNTDETELVTADEVTTKPDELQEGHSDMTTLPTKDVESHDEIVSFLQKNFDKVMEMILNQKVDLHSINERLDSLEERIEQLQTTQQNLSDNLEVLKQKNKEKQSYEEVFEQKRRFVTVRA